MTMTSFKFIILNCVLELGLDILLSVVQSNGDQLPWITRNAETRRRRKRHKHIKAVKA